MLKKYYRILPYLLLALVITAISAILDGNVTRKMMKLLDFALSGDVQTMKEKAPELLILAAFMVPLGILVAMTNNYYKRKANVSLKKYYIKKVFGKNIAEFQKENNAKYLSAMTNDFDTLENNLITGIYSVGSGSVSFLVGIWLLSTVDVRMILLAVAIIIVNLTISMLTSKPTKKAYKERSDMFDGYTSYIKEILSAFHIVKNYNLQDRVTEDYNEKSEKIQHKGFLIERMLTFIYSTNHLFINGSLYGVICGIGYLAVLGKVTPGGLLLVVEGIQRMMWPLFNISENLPKLFTSGDLINKIEKTLENTNAYVETIDFPEFKQEIEFKDVEFSYEDDEQLILSEVNLKVRKNGKYLIVGPSGGGKSTLLKLFRKYFNPSTGKILIDGYDLRDIKRDQYFKLVANIEQQVFIFEDTIKNNITLYKEYSDQEINEAIEASGLTEFIKQKSEGLNSIIYDNGKNISGGERSRIVIARALLNKASILFMDEAFASLDMERAREIEKTILGLKDITVINVSHVIFKDTRELYDRVLTVKKTIY
ncbi:MAG: transporter related [Herbinix sp.]|jgi:ABC-type multidrug transport system fused ATPase/permease subunit|nr:transporter related [Herbinix sp.]